MKMSIPTTKSIIAVPMIQLIIFFLCYARGFLRLKAEVANMPSPPAYPEMRSGTETSLAMYATAMNGNEMTRIAT